ncbi:hypothetical protein FVV62_19840 [Escherichia coli]|nr:hypothetical protein [Escherichia coli]
MNNSEGLKSFQQSLADLPQWVSERLLQQINQLTNYEPVIGIMGKPGPEWFLSAFSLSYPCR